MMSSLGSKMTTVFVYGLQVINAVFMWGYQQSNTTNSKHIRYYIKFCITKKLQP